jgi:hypothetical protein
MKNRIKPFIKKLTGNSFFYNTSARVLASYRNFENKVEEVYRQSHTGKCFFSIFHFLEIIFRNSLIGRLTEIPEDGEDVSGEILWGSRVFQYLAFRWNEAKEKALMSASQSQSGELCSSIAGPFFNRPLQIGGQVVLVAVIFNSLLSFMLEADVSLFGIMMRATLFLLSFFCLVSECDWRDLEETSYVVKKYLEPLP